MSSFCATHIFSAKNFSIFAYHDVNFNESLINDIVSFEQLGPGCQKNGAFRAIHILFVEKRGPIIYLAALKKGAIRHAHPYYAIYRKLPPPPPEQTVWIQTRVGWGGVWGAGNFLYVHTADVRAKWPPFSGLPGI